MLNYFQWDTKPSVINFISLKINVDFHRFFLKKANTSTVIILRKTETSEFIYMPQY